MTYVTEGSPCREKELNRRLIPCRKKERSRRLLARIKGLCILYPSGTAEAMPKFLADSFHAHRHLPAIFKGLCIIYPSGTAEAIPKIFS